MCLGGSPLSRLCFSQVPQSIDLNVSIVLVLLLVLGSVRVTAAETQTTIAGAVFEDLNGDGNMNDGMPRPHVRVRVYADTTTDNQLSSSDLYIADATTGSDGRYSIAVTPSLHGDRFFVAVDSRSVTPSAGFNVGYAQGDVWPEQTYGDDWIASTLDLGPRYGGRGEELTGQSNTSDQFRISTTFTNNPYRHLAFVDLSGGSVDNLHWGFSFNVVTNGRAGAGTDHDTATSARRTVQGSFRQFLQNANAIAGPNTMRFVPTVRFIRDNHWPIDVSVALPPLTDSGTTIDGMAHQIDGLTARDSNTGQLGVGGSVGVEQQPLARVDRPELGLIKAGTSNIGVGLDVQASNTTIRRIAITGFGTAPDSDTSANILIANAANNVLLEHNVVGTTATTFSEPNSRTAGDNIRVLGGTGTIRNNLVGFAAGNGVALGSGSAWQIEANEIRGNGLGDSMLSGIASTNARSMLRGNLIVNQRGSGITAHGSVIENNTISNNGIGTGTNVSDAGVRLTGDGSSVLKNVISNNYGAGVLVTATAQTNTISQNAISGNGSIANSAGRAPTGQIGIDLLASGDDQVRGSSPFVTRNDDGDGDVGGNGLLNVPVLESATIQHNQLTITGFALAGAHIELFVAAPDASGFGEGLRYLATVVEGSSDDLDPASGSYRDPINGIDHGSDTTTRFRFTIAAPDGVGANTTLTATATVAGATSEFSGLVAVQMPPTAITLLRFAATSSGDHVTVEWKTATERDTFGFHIYRSVDGTWNNAAMVSPLIVPEGAGFTGSSYTWRDHDVVVGETYSYWLQEVEISGATARYGPVTVSAAHHDVRLHYLFVPMLRQ